MSAPPPVPDSKPKTPSRISAANCILAAAFFYTLIPLLVIFVGGAVPHDTLGFIFLSVVIVLALSYWTAGILLYKRSRIGLYIWWPASIVVLLNFPLGTLIGGLAYMHLSKPDAKEELR